MLIDLCSENHVQWAPLYGVETILDLGSAKALASLEVATPPLSGSDVINSEGTGSWKM